MRIAKIAFALLMLGCLSVAGAAEDMPKLMLDTGGHQALIRSIIFTSDGKYLVSAGDDKVVRVWDLQAGKIVRTIRGQIGPESEGRIFAMALSPDERWLAVGGWMTAPPSDDHVIRLYDFATGTLKALLKGHTSVVNTFAFSPDGTRLISGSWDYSAIIWDVASARPLHRLESHQGAIFGATFTNDGARAVTASQDKTLRLWNVASGSLVKVMSGHSDTVYSVTVSPKDDTITSGSERGEIRLWDGKTGEFRRTLSKPYGWAGTLRYSPDGELLLTICSQFCNDGYKQRVVEVATGKELTVYDKHDNTVWASGYSSDGRLVATGGGNNDEIHVWDPRTGIPKIILKGTGQTVWSAAFSSDGRRIAWGQSANQVNANNRGPLEMALQLPAMREALGEPVRVTNQQDWVRASPKFGEWTLQTKEGGDHGFTAILEILKSGKVQASIVRDNTNGFRHRAYTFTPDGQTVISGGAYGVLTAYGLDSKPISSFIGHESEVWAMSVSPDGKYLVSGSDDQTVRLWNAKSRELLVTLYYGTDNEWVMWTPQGYYTASPNGEKIVGWQINKGADQAAEYVTGYQLRRHFYRPDVVERAIILASAKAAIGEAQGTDFSLTDLLKRLPPAFKIVSPSDGSRATATQMEIVLQVEPSDDPLEAIEVLVNGRQTTTPAVRTASARSAPSGMLERRVEVPLEPGENQIRVVVRNKVGQTVRDFVLFQDRPGTIERSGTLYVLAVGVDNYPQMPALCGPDGKQGCNLRFAGADAQAFRDVLIKRMGPQFKDIKTLLLTRNGDKPPTKANIEDALGEMFGRAGPDDTTVLFIAGHGVNDGRRREYLFLPEDAELSGDSWRNSTVLSWLILQNALQNTQGRRFMFADTCHSGGAFNKRLVNDAADANIIVFSATDPQTLSWEFAELAHGAFTYALMQGLEGKARGVDGTVTIFDLAAYVSKEVARLTKNAQQPTFHVSGAKNLTLASQ